MTDNEGSGVSVNVISTSAGACWSAAPPAGTDRSRSACAPATGAPASIPRQTNAATVPQRTVYSTPGIRGRLGGSTAAPGPQRGRGAHRPEDDADHRERPN